MPCDCYPEALSLTLVLTAVRADDDMDGCIVTRIQGKPGGLFEPGQTIMSVKA